MSSYQEILSRVGIVVIGRNEGERLVRCLDSVTQASGVTHIVYVDSGSTDGSLDVARERGVEVVELDLSRPFNMARGRNAGFSKLMTLDPDLTFVQFVDGDCEVIEGWLDKAYTALREDDNIGLVTGIRAERYRNASIYNRLTDMDWVGEAGEVETAGGDVMMRAEAYRSAQGYDESMLGAEDPNLSVCLRQKGWKIIRLDVPMTRHDIAMDRFSQWWKRSIRNGRDAAELAHRHGKLTRYSFRKRVRSNWAWGLILPLLALALAWPTRGLSLLVMSLLFLAWSARIALKRHRQFGDSWADSWLYGFWTMLSKFARVYGQALYWSIRLGGRKGGVIEYK